MEEKRFFQIDLTGPIAVFFVYTIGGAILSYVLIILAAMFLMDWSLSAARASGVYTLTRGLAFWGVTGLVLTASVGNHLTIWRWRTWVRPAAWSALYAVLAASSAFFMQLHYLNRKTGGWNQADPTNPRWVLPTKYWDPIVLWMCGTLLLFFTIGFLKSAGPKAIPSAAAGWGRRVSTCFRKFNPRGLGWLLWGASMGMLLGSNLAPKIALLAAFTAVFFSTSRFILTISVLMNRFMGLIDLVIGWISRTDQAKSKLHPKELTLSVLGFSLALLLTTLTGKVSLVWTFLIALMGGIILAGSGAQAELAVLVLGIGAFHWLVQSGTTLADDGTWAENGTFPDLVNQSGGVESVRNAGELARLSGAGANMGGLAGEQFDDEMVADHDDFFTGGESAEQPDSGNTPPSPPEGPPERRETAGEDPPTGPDGEAERGNPEEGGGVPQGDVENDEGDGGNEEPAPRRRPIINDPPGG